MSSPYALANPVAQLLDKAPDSFTRDDIIRVIEKKQLERITLHYTALDGKLKEMRVPISNRQQAERILASGERVDGSSLFKGMVDTGLSDVYVVPVYKTAFLNPFDSRSMDLICRYFAPDGSPAPFALDNVLDKAYGLFRRKTGMELHALGELEFYLLSHVDSHIYQTSKQKGYHASAPFIKSGPILNEMVRHIAQITGVVKYAHSEVGYIESVFSHSDEIRGRQAEQLEIEFLSAPITDMADYLVLARWLIRNIAYQSGCVATFAPKLEEGVAGSGLHVHMELVKSGRNVMRETGGHLTAEATKLIGGLCRYADSLTAFGNTVSASYLRLVPNQEAPTRICWSDLNRSAMIRVPLGWTQSDNLSGKVNPQQPTPYENGDGRQTVEIRSPDGSAIIHPLLAGITLAAEWGLTNKESTSLAESLYVQGNIFKDQDLMKKLPTIAKSCVESSRILHERRAYYERDGVFPAAAIDYMINLLRSESDEILHQTLDDLPADERLNEMRKIMHKDLHRH